MADNVTLTAADLSAYKNVADSIKSRLTDTKMLTVSTLGNTPSKSQIVAGDGNSGLRLWAYSQHATLTKAKGSITFNQQLTGPLPANKNFVASTSITAEHADASHVYGIVTNTTISSNGTITVHYNCTSGKPTTGKGAMSVTLNVIAVALV